MNFRKFWKFGVLCPAPFFSKNCPKFPKISWNFVNFFKIKKTIIFVSKLVWNHYIDENSAEFSHKTPKKRSIFSKTPLFFKIFGAFGALNLEFYVPKIPKFLEKGSPLGGGPPPKYLWMNHRYRVLQVSTEFHKTPHYLSTFIKVLLTNCRVSSEKWHFLGPDIFRQFGEFSCIFEYFTLFHYEMVLNQ